MDFVTLEYFVFLVSLTVLFYFVKTGYKAVFIVISNLVFYYFFGILFTLIFYSVVLITYSGGVLLNRKQGGNKLSLLWIFVLMISAVLIFFKFQKFFYSGTQLLFPIGLSFLVFKSISYLIEIYRGNNTFKVTFVNSLLYLSFFPSIRSGPIDKPNVLLSQFENKIEFDIDNILFGIKLILWGVFKKIVIADRLAFFVGNIYDNPYNYKGFPLVLSTILYSLQIYYDFSGYTDIALGSANLLGVKLTNNFNRPYFSKNIQEFWRKWHISLSVWLRDYLFLPVSYFFASKFIKNKFTAKKFDILSYAIGIFTTMLIAGFWHGNGFNFIIWGLLFAFYITFARVFKKLKSRMVRIAGIKRFPFVYSLFQIIITFSLVSFAWTFFRANNVNDAIYIIKNSFFGLNNISVYIYGFRDVINGITEFDNSYAEFVYVCFFVIIAEVLQVSINDKEFINRYPVVLKWVVYYFLIFSILLFGVSHFQKFIYYNF